jgi:hypothetical protein
VEASLIATVESVSDPHTVDNAKIQIASIQLINRSLLTQRCKSNSKNSLYPPGKEIKSF